MVQYVEQTYDRAHISKREKKNKMIFSYKLDCQGQKSIIQSNNYTVRFGF